MIDRFQTSREPEVIYPGLTGPDTMHNLMAQHELRYREELTRERMASAFANKGDDSFEL